MAARPAAPAALLLVVAFTVGCASPSGSPVPSVTASPSETGPTGDDIVEAFLNLVSDEELTFHSEVIATAAFGEAADQTESFGMSMDVSGEDGVGEQWNENSDDEPQPILITDGESYHSSGGGWATDDALFTANLFAPLNPFLALDGDEVSYDGTVERDEETLHRLASEVWLSPDALVIVELNDQTASVEDSENEILVDELGIPVAWEFHGFAVGEGTDSAISMTLDVTYTFSDVGNPVEIPESVDGSRVHWTELHEGDCFDIPDEAGEEINDVVSIPCAGPHVYETFWAGPMPDGEYSGDAGAEAFFDQNCLPAFVTYVGRDYESSIWYAYWLGPSELAWTEGERSFLCSLANSDETPVTGSARGSGQ